MGELYGSEGPVWSVYDNVLRIRGTKPENADRVVPRFARHLFKARAGDAGLPSNRVEQYFG